MGKELAALHHDKYVKPVFHWRFFSRETTFFAHAHARLQTT